MSGLGEEGETVDSEAYDGFNKDKGEVEYDTNDKCLIYAFEVHLMVMSKAVEQAAQNTTGKKQLAVDSFAHALKQLPTILADNAGLDSSDLVTRLRQAINNGMTSSGLDLLTPGGGIADMRDLGVVEAYKLKKAVVSSASEAAEVCHPIIFLARFLCLLTIIYSCFCGWTTSSGLPLADGSGCNMIDAMWR